MRAANRTKTGEWSVPSLAVGRVRTHCSQHGCEPAGHCGRCVVNPERANTGPGLPFPVHATPRVVWCVWEFRPIEVCHSKAREDTRERVGIVRVVWLQGPTEPVDGRQRRIEVARDDEGGVALGCCVDQLGDS